MWMESVQQSPIHRKCFIVTVSFIFPKIGIESLAGDLEIRLQQPQFQVPSTCERESSSKNSVTQFLSIREKCCYPVHASYSLTGRSTSGKAFAQVHWLKRRLKYLTQRQIILQCNKVADDERQNIQVKTCSRASSPGPLFTNVYSKQNKAKTKDQGG